MQTLPQPADSLGEARPVSEILSRADPADMPAMRAGLSFLTSAGAELAAALEKSHQENQRLNAIISALPPEWVQAATTGEAFPDFGALRAELELLKDERIDLRGQLVERDQLIEALNQQVVQIDTEEDARLALEAPQPQPSPEAEALAALQAEMESVSLARAQAEDGLRTSEAELADVEQQLAGLSADLLAALPEDVRAQLAATPAADEQTEDRRQRRAMRLGALAAASSALLERSQQGDALADQANSRAAAIQADLEAASSARMALEADLNEKVQTLEDLQNQVESLEAESEGLNAQIEQLKEQTVALQGQLDAALAAKAAAEEQLVAREGELAELNQQIDSVSQQLRTVLPEDVLAQITAADAAAPDEEAPGEEMAEDGEMVPRGAAPKMLGLGALVAGVTAAVDLSQQKSHAAEEASGLLGSVEEQRVSLESALGEKEQAIAALNAQIEALNAQSADVQAQLDAALAATAGLEQQVGERDGLLNDLQGQMQDAVSRLQEIVPAEYLPQPEVVEAAETEVVEGEAVESEAVEGEGGAVKVAGLAALVSGVAALVDRHSSTALDLQAQLDGLGQEKAALEATLEAKLGELASYNDYSLNLQGQVNELAARATSADAALALKEQAEVEAQAQIEALNAQIEALNSQAAALTVQIEDLQSQLDAVTGAKTELEQTLQATQAQLDAAQADLAQIEEESARALGSRAAGLGAVGAGVAAVSALRDKEAELAEANNQLLALQAQVNELAAGNTDVDALRGQLEELSGAKIDVEGQLTQRDAELADLRSQLAALQEQQAAMVEERASLQAELVHMEEESEEVNALRSAALSFESASTLSEALSRLPAFKTSAASAAIVAGVQPVLSPRIQALTDVVGIGSAYQQRLYTAGVGTYWELSSLPDAELETILKIPELQRARIEFEDTRADAYQWAQKTGTIGLLWDGDHVDDFEPLPGVGKTFEKRLYEAGITTYEQLIECGNERLAEIVKAPPMREIDYGAWKERAQQFLVERQAAQPAEPDQPSE